MVVVRVVVDMLCHLPDMVRGGTCTGRQEGVLKHKLGTIKTTINETCLLQAKKENQYFFFIFTTHTPQFESIQNLNRN